MARPSVLVVLPFVLATLLATANAQNYKAPTPSPVTEEPADSTSPPPPPPESSSSPPSPPPPPSNDWTPVANVNDTKIQQVAKFAVRMESLSSKERNDMQLLNVVSGETQPYDGGYNYRLVIITVNGGEQTQQYEAFVWGILGTTKWKLMYFTPKY